MELIESNVQEDAIASALRRYAQNILVIVFGLLPLLFLPLTAAQFEYTKIMIVLGGVLVALVLFSLSVLRSGTVSLGVSYPVIAIWVVAALVSISALISGDIKDAFIGDALGIHTAAFVVILALAISVWLLLRTTKIAVVRLYKILAASTLTLVVFHVIRLIWGPSILSFGVFANAAASPVGTWNDLALFLGLSVILSLVALEQFPLTRPGRTLITVVTVFALAMLGIINFFTVWLVLGITSLALVVYGLSKDRYQSAQPTLVQQKSPLSSSLVLSLVVFAASVLFIIGGSGLGGFISQYTKISYVEVRPSFQSTVDIARNVYHGNTFFGIGPNRFTDAWRLYKDPTINTTIFWNTDFNAGNGYISTFFVTTGILGGLAWLAFLILFCVTGIRLLLTAPDTDRMWYFIGVSSFVSAMYIWGMSLIYVPGATILFIGALCTAITLTAYGVLKSPRTYTISVLTNRRTGFILTLVVIAVIVGSVSVLYGAGRHYAAAYTFSKSLVDATRGVDISTVESEVQNAYALYPSDTYLRGLAEINLSKMSGLLTVQKPTPDQQNQFNAAVVAAVNAATTATQIDPTESANWSLLGRIYGTLMAANIDGVYNRALDAFNNAKTLNPKNPLSYLEIAVLEARAGQFDKARTDTETAIGLKPNYSDALYYLSQIEIATGKVDDAIKATQSIVALEPQNPARYYQLGVLYTAQKNVDDAITSFEKAISLDQNYANARYLLALAYDLKGRKGDAKAQLEKVLELNPGNAEVTALLQILAQKGTLAGTGSATTSNSVVNETNQVRDNNGTVTTDKAPDTPLVTPVNTAPKSGNGTASPTRKAQ